MYMYLIAIVLLLPIVTPLTNPSSLFNDLFTTNPYFTDDVMKLTAHIGVNLFSLARGNW